MSSPTLQSPTRTQSQRPRSTIPRNYSNPSYHTSIDIAKAYSGMVNSHLIRTGQGHHMLSTVQGVYNKDALKASQSYSSNGKLRRSKSSISNRAGTVKTIKIINKKIVRNPQEDHQPNDNNTKSVLIHQNMEPVSPQFLQLREVLSRKTERVPEYSQDLNQVYAEQTKLQEYIKQLKNMITSQIKQKSKASLSCSKILNQRELTHKNYCNKYQQNYHLSVTISSTQKQIIALEQQVSQLHDKNSTMLQNIEHEQKQCEQLKQLVMEQKRSVMSQSKSVSKLKGQVTSSFYNMENNYMNLNLLRSEKALILADVQQQHSKNR